MIAIHWSLKNLPNFYGKKDGTEDASTHFVEFDGFLKAVGIQIQIENIP